MNNRIKNHEPRIRNQESRTTKNRYIKIGWLILIFGLFVINTNAQTTTDSLSLSQIINQIVQSHPSIKEAEEALNIADAKIGMAKAGYLPNVDASANYTRIYPVPEITFYGNKFQMAPANNYNAGVNVNQTVYDFGKTEKEVASEKENKNFTQQNIDQLKQRISVSAINTFYTLGYLQDAILIKQEEINTLNGHLEYVQKKRETGSATKYEILSTQVRISNVESQKTDLETAHKVQSSVLNSLLGQPGKTPINVKKEIIVSLPDVISDSLVSYAISHRNEIKIAHEKETLAQLKYNVAKSQNNPVIAVFASGGVKDGYFPDNATEDAKTALQKPKFNWAAGVGFKIPIFDGKRVKNSSLIAKSDIQNTSYETDMAIRNISNEVLEAETNLDASKKKINQFEMQLSQAKQALFQAETNFKAGAITNLDLLDATTSVSESQLLYLKSQIDYVASIYKLKAAIGDKLY